jgi:glutathione S-transferase
MSSPRIYYDPTSEPCRAVLWLCLEENIPHTLEYTWLTRNQHLTKEFLLTNPLHQVPALKHGKFCLSEATAIMQYLADLNNCSSVWFGADIERKATISKFLSWYHTNLRKILTLDYFLPVLLMPAYLGTPKPVESEINKRKQALHTMLEQLNAMLEDRLFLSGSEISCADILFAAEFVALQIDPEYGATLAKYGGIANWLANLQAMPSYRGSHKEWNHVAPLISSAIAEPKRSPEWVAEACEQVNS